MARPTRRMEVKQRERMRTAATSSLERCSCKADDEWLGWLVGWYELKNAKYVEQSAGKGNQMQMHWGTRLEL